MAAENSDIVVRLDGVLTTEFATLLTSERLTKAMQPGGAKLSLYANYLVQTYHYTRHNPRHQALVVTRDIDFPAGYANYCLKHAREEWGHELMALNDLRKIGYNSKELPEPLTETLELINYLYEISTSGSVYRRLGYTFWAERCYGFINGMIKEIAKNLDLGDSEMTFLVEHSEIDVKHAQEVEECIRKYVTHPDDEAQVEDVMVQSLRLTYKMLEAVYDSFESSSGAEWGELSL